MKKSKGSYSPRADETGSETAARKSGLELGLIRQQTKIPNPL